MEGDEGSARPRGPAREPRENSDASSRCQSSAGSAPGAPRWSASCSGACRTPPGGRIVPRGAGPDALLRRPPRRPAEPERRPGSRFRCLDSGVPVRATDPRRPRPRGPHPSMQPRAGTDSPPAPPSRESEPPLPSRRQPARGSSGTSRIGWSRVSVLAVAPLLRRMTSTAASPRRRRSAASPSSSAKATASSLRSET
jgi:hypothetical protein